MPSFSKRSLDNLATCDPRLQAVCKEVIKHFDFTVTCGHRDKEEQNDAFARGASKAPWPESAHNKIPSQAVDIYPYPINFKDTARMRYFAGFMVGTAKQMGINLRWGGDWDSDTLLDDQTFNDLPHFELED